MTEMYTSGIPPSVNTFNALLSVIMRYSRFKKARMWAMSAINEMKHLNIGKNKWS